MSQQALQDLTGTLVLSDFRLDTLTYVDDAIATFRATCTPDGSVCSARVSLSLEVGEHQEASLQAAFTRIARHAVGIRALAPPRAAGVVTVDGIRRLVVVHAGDPSPSAAERIASGRQASIDEVLALLEPIAEALGALHDQGIVHGAVHAGAVRLDPAGATLSAFGLGELASVIGGPSAARDVLPARSRTPEQVGLVPASPSPESDTYALATIALELIAGKPFTEETDPRELARVIDHPIERPSPRHLGVDLSDAAEQAFSKVLRTGPRERTADPRAFLTQLSDARWSRGTPADPSPESPIEAPTESPASNADASGFEPPPKPVPTVHQPSNFYPPPPEDPAKTRSNDLFVYALVGLGSLLLLAGVGIAFYFVMESPAPTPSPVSTVTPPPLAPPPAPPMPKPPEDARPLDPDGPAEDAARDAGLPERTWPSPPNASYPEDATALIPIEPGTAVMGSRDALVTVVLFANMRCPYSRRARAALERLMVQYDSELRVAVRHLPVSEYPGSELSAEVAASTYALEGPQIFWSVFEKLTENQADHTRDKLLGWASDAGADEDKLRAALDAHSHRSVVQRDVELAGQLMVRATPTFFVNGRRFDGMQPQATLVDAIEAERIAARAASSSGTKPAALYSARVLFNVTSAAADRRSP